MSRTALLLGLIASVAMHGYLLWQGVPSTTVGSPKQVAQIAKVLMLDEPAPAETMPEQLPELTDPVAESPPEPVEQQQPEPVEDQPVKPTPPDPAPAEQQQQHDQTEPMPNDAQPRTAEAPALDRVHQQTAANDPTPGDFAGNSNRTDAAYRPGLRIDWGNERQARRIIKAGRMKLVILRRDRWGRGGPSFDTQLTYQGDQWVTARFDRAAQRGYSNRLRVVDDVPAFGRASRHLTLQPGDRLAVVVPTRIERVLEHAQIQAARQRGLRIEQVRNFAGRFALVGNELRFHMTYIQPRVN